MFYLEHLPAVLGTCLVIVACTGSADEAEPEVAPPAEGEAALSDELGDDRPGDTNADGDPDPETDADPDAVSREPIDAAGEASDAPDTASDAYRRRCDRRNAWHCRRGHRGWRWVRIPSYDGWYRCCVRARHPHHW